MQFTCFVPYSEEVHFLVKMCTRKKIRRNCWQSIIPENSTLLIDFFILLTGMMIALAAQVNPTQRTQLPTWKYDNPQFTEALKRVAKLGYFPRGRRRNFPNTFLGNIGVDSTLKMARGDIAGQNLVSLSRYMVGLITVQRRGLRGGLPLLGNFFPYIVRTSFKMVYCISRLALKWIGLYLGIPVVFK